MKGLLLPSLATALSASLLLAQDTVQATAIQQKAQSAAKKAHKKVLAQFTKANDAYKTKRTAITKSDEYKKMRADRDYTGLNELMRSVQAPNDDFVPKFLEVAQKHADHPDAAESMLWIVLNSRNQKDAVKEATDLLVSKHIGSDKVYSLALNYFYLTRALGNDGTRAVLTAIIDGSKDKETVAEALYARSEMVRRNRNASAEERKAAEADLERLKKVAPDSTPVLRMNGPEFVRTRLQIGMEAPDIEGEDIDGVKFKLSDYRGKVVVVDFWGDW